VSVLADYAIPDPASRPFDSEDFDKVLSTLNQVNTVERQSRAQEAWEEFYGV
jgi:hypothetical protein